MRTPLVSIVVAATENGVIGRDNGMPWHLPDDLKHFKQLTLGRYLLLGRRTFEAIGGPLPGRTTLLMTRDPHFQPAGVTVVRSVEGAYEAAVQADAPELVIGGGAQIFSEALPRVQRIHFTRIHAVIDGDTFMPDIGPGWREVARVEHPVDERHAYAMSFITLERG